MPTLRSHRCATSGCTTNSSSLVSAVFILSCFGLLGGNLLLLSFLPPSKMAHLISGSFLGNTALLPGTFTGQYPSYLLSSLYRLPSHPFSKTTPACCKEILFFLVWRAASLKVTFVYNLRYHHISTTIQAFKTKSKQESSSI